MQDNKPKSSSGDNLEYLFREAERLVQSDNKDDQIIGASVFKWLHDYGGKLAAGLKDNPEQVEALKLAQEQLRKRIEKL